MSWRKRKLQSSWGELYLEGLDHKRNFRIREAKECFDKSLQLSISARDSYGIASNRCELGKMYSQARAFDRAIAHLNEALAIFEKLSDPEGVASCLQGLTDLDLQLGKVNEALEKAATGKRLAEQYGVSEDVEIFETRINIAQKMKEGQDILWVVHDPKDYGRQMGLQNDPKYRFWEVVFESRNRPDAGFSPLFIGDLRFSEFSISDELLDSKLVNELITEAETLFTYDPLLHLIVANLLSSTTFILGESSLEIRRTCLAAEALTKLGDKEGAVNHYLSAFKEAQKIQDHQLQRHISGKLASLTSDFWA
jgi:tetratricopeptide (TPR) repeat protein